MSIIATKPSLNLRAELSTLKGQIHRLLNRGRMQEFWYSNLVTNGAEWTGATGATPPIGWTSDGINQFSLGSGQLTITRNSGDGYLNQNIDFKLFRKYLFSVDLIAVSVGDFCFYTHGATSRYDLIINKTSPDTYTKTTVVDSDLIGVSLRASNNLAAACTVDNVSIFEVDDADEVIYTLPPGWKPRFVFEDGGSIQREGAAYDYETLYNGTYWYVKPTVQPTAGSAAWCVIGEAI